MRKSLKIGVLICPHSALVIRILTVNTGADPGFDQGGAPDCDRPKTAILGPQFCRILVLGPHFWWSGGARAPGAPPGSAPVIYLCYQLQTFP